MNDLRLALVGLGIVAIAALWLWSVYVRRRRDRPPVRPGVSAKRGAGRRRTVAGRSPGRGARAAAHRAQRDENLALDPGFGPRDSLEDDHEAGLGRRPERETNPARATRARRDTTEDRLAGDREEEEDPDALADAWIASGLEGLRATRDEPGQIVMDAFEAEPGAVWRAANAVQEDDPVESGEPAPLVVVLTVLAPPGEKLNGAALRAALEARELRYGEDRLFHLYPDAGSPGAGPLFSAVNAVEPGVFDLDTMDSLRTPGIGLFMRLPGPEDPAAAFAAMIDAARDLADALDAQLCDETRSKLTAQTLNHLRERIADHGRRRLPRA